MVIFNFTQITGFLIQKMFFGKKEKCSEIWRLIRRHFQYRHKTYNKGQNSTARRMYQCRPTSEFFMGEPTQLGDQLNVRDDVKNKQMNKNTPCVI